MECSACKAEIGKDYDNALPITLHGGYGMFFDTDFSAEHPDTYHLLLCHTCAHKLVGSSQFLTRLLEHGHFHDFIYDEHGDLYSEKHGAECIKDFRREWGTL